MNKERVTYHISHFINMESGIISLMKANFAALTTKNHKMFWNEIVKYCYCDWGQFSFCELLLCDLGQILPTTYCDLLLLLLFCAQKMLGHWTAKSFEIS